MINGILNVYKEKGFTSHDVVAKLRGITGQRKIGHTGTLDPEAEGVLPICLGRATKVCELLTDQDKTYEAVLLLGVRTDTQDTAGTVLEEGDASAVTGERLKETVKNYIGDYDQIPPMYSALKVNGKKLYELAREGKTVERKARRVRIHEIEILDIHFPRIRMRVDCSKGTYIRTLCDDIGRELGCFGCMESLVRTKAGPFEKSGAHTLEEIEQRQKQGTLGEILRSIDSLFQEYPAVYVEARWEKLALNGNSLRRGMIRTEGRAEDGERVRLYNEKGDFLALYGYQKKTQEYKAVKMFCGS